MECHLLCAPKHLSSLVYCLVSHLPSLSDRDLSDNSLDDTSLSQQSFDGTSSNVLDLSYNLFTMPPLALANINSIATL